MSRKNNNSYTCKSNGTGGLVVIYYVRETKCGMMAADSELTKQLSLHTLLKNSVKFK